MTEFIKRVPSKISYCEISEFKELELPGRNEQIRFITNKAKSTTDFIDHILSGEKVEHIIIANSAIDRKSLNRICEIKDKGILVHIVINQSETERKHKIISDLLEVEETRLHRLHTKIILIKTSNSHYVLEGSGNVSTNAKIEQYSLINCKESYVFHEKWITDIFNIEEKNIKEGEMEEQPKTIQQEVEELASLQFSKEEVSVIVGEEHELLDIWFKRGRLKGEAEVRKSILAQAKQGSSPAQKEYMGLIKDREKAEKIKRAREAKQ